MGDRAISGQLVGTAGPALRGVTSIPGGVCGAVFIVKSAALATWSLRREKLHDT